MGRRGWEDVKKHRGLTVKRGKGPVQSRSESFTWCSKSATLLVRGDAMPVRNPRVSVVLERPLYERLQALAEREGVSVSSVVRDLIREALEIKEDLALAHLAEERERTWKDSEALGHEEVWS